MKHAFRVERFYRIYRIGHDLHDDHEHAKPTFRAKLHEGSIVVEKVRAETNPNFGFNAQTEKYEDLVKAGVIDPTKVATWAIDNRHERDAI